MIRSVISDVSKINQLKKQLHHALKMEAIGTLTGGIAHDFSNILSIIIGNTELALDKVPDYNPAVENLDEIRTGVFRASDIVKQLLTFTRKSEEKKTAGYAQTHHCRVHKNAKGNPTVIH